MDIRFYNTLSNSMEAFNPLDAGKVRIYTCGPTVYDYAHIGNFRSYVFEDLVKRYFIYSGYDVKHVMNITDIDDKTIKKANEMNATLDTVTRQFIDAFFLDIDKLNIIRADVYPRATQHINEMIAIIEKLESKGFAYRKGDSVYFSIEKFPEYGQLANISRDQLNPGLRSEADEYEKENIQDFVLWKGKKEGEPYWTTPFGDGRPGWHIECSAMSMKHLGEHFDIHMGGVDNIFPHHENEIAQSRCSTGKPYVNYWIHCQHLIVEDKKMSKSLKNQYTLADLIDRGYDAMAIRYLLLSTHYRKLLKFTFKGLDSAKQSLRRITDFVFAISGLTPAKGKSEEFSRFIEENENAFKLCMNDDFNISGALGIFFESIHYFNLHMNQLKQGDVENVLGYIDRVNSVLGVIETEEVDSLDEQIMTKIELREKARRNKDFQLADTIRDELKSSGIVLVDTPEGVRWKRGKE
jgi:cysteinyl-tRNA synthetase